MHYAIVCNPAAGRKSREEKHRTLKGPAAILGAAIHGLDTTTPRQFAECIREVARRADVVVVAGGDGSFSEALNAVDCRDTVLGYLPLGSGNALARALSLPRGLHRVAHRIRAGECRTWDVVVCDGRRRALMASIGLEGRVAFRREQLRRKGKRGGATYAFATLSGLREAGKTPSAGLQIDGSIVAVSRLLTLMVMKHPYYGFGMRVMPEAVPDDGWIHTRWLDCGKWGAVRGLLACLGSRGAGCYARAREVHVRLSAPARLQVDGSPAWEACRFHFAVRCAGLRIKV